MKKTVDVITLGCSKNLVDSELLMRQFEALGYQVRHDPQNPNGEIVIINTCGFIGDAKEESIRTILQFAERRKKNKIDKSEIEDLKLDFSLEQSLISKRIVLTIVKTIKLLNKVS